MAEEVPSNMIFIISITFINELDQKNMIQGGKKLVAMVTTDAERFSLQSWNINISVTRQNFCFIFFLN